MGYLTAHAGASSLQKVCGFATDDRKTLSKPEVDLLAKRLDLIKKDLTEFCKKPEFLVNVGPLSMFRVGDKSIAMLYQDRNGNIKDAMNFPKANIAIKQAIVTMDDGVKIPTYTITSTDKKSQNTFLERTPYFGMGAGIWYYPMYLASAGNTVVLQPARGTFLAEGQFEWLDWKREARDAKSTLDWMSQFSWGKNIIAIGTSYNAFLAMTAATTQHPNLIAVAAASGPWNPSKDSLSMNGLAYPALEYVTKLNWDSDMGMATGQDPLIEKLAKKYNAQSAEDAIERSRTIYNLKLTSLSKKKLASNGSDFVEALKKSKALMLYGFGEDGDQDSREVINLAHLMQGQKNHYFFAHMSGHSYSPLIALIQAPAKSFTRENIQEVVATFGGKQFCTLAGCKDSVPFYKINPVTYRLEKPSIENASTQGVLGKSNFAILIGQHTVKMEIESNEKSDISIMMGLASCTTYATSEKCTVIGGGTNITATVIKPGIHTYEIMSQHERTAISGDINFRAKFESALGLAINNPKVKINYIELTLPVL